MGLRQDCATFSKGYGSKTKSVGISEKPAFRIEDRSDRFTISLNEGKDMDLPGGVVRFEWISRIRGSTRSMH